jgi:leader peptidase (prepilin peptidase)/N-methyltransferase
MGVALVGLVALLAGFAVGALLPRPVYQLSVAADAPPRRGCVHCGQSLGWTSHCPQCGEPWGPPWWATGAVAGVGSAVVALAIGPHPVLPLFVALVVLGTGLGAIDLACHRLPLILVSPAIGVGAVLLALLAAVTGEWGSFGRALLGAVVLGVVYYLLYLVPGQNLGFGDVRLAVLLGLFLGWLGWAQVIWGILLPWLVNGPVVLALLLTGRVTRKSRLPFGPAMLAGALLAVVVPVAVGALLNR